jgi:hypothetical protein
MKAMREARACIVHHSTNARAHLGSKVDNRSIGSRATNMGSYCEFNLRSGVSKPGIVLRKCDRTFPVLT